MTSDGTITQVPPATRRLVRIAMIVGLLVAPALFILWKALADPAVNFLAPSLAADWIVEPFEWNMDVVPWGEDTSTFVLAFEGDDVAPQARLELKAFRNAVVRLNGVALQAGDSPENWKRTRSMPLGEFVEPGTNTLAIDVANAGAGPGLLVTEPEALRTGVGAWAMADGRPHGWASRPPHRPGPLQRWAGWPVAKYFGAAWLLFAVVLGAIAAFGRERPPEPLRVPKWVRAAVPSILLAGCAVLAISNAVRMPAWYSILDYTGHAEYVAMMAAEWRAPLAEEGWQMYHPPLYYVVAAVVSPVGGEKAVQLLSALSAVAIGVFAWLGVRRDDERGSWTVLLFAAFLPMSLTLSPTLSNELFAGAVIGGVLVLSAAFLSRGDIGPRKAALLGVCAGLAMLTKFTALMLVVSTAAAIALCLASNANRRTLAAGAAYLGAVAVVAGWYYARNALTYGDPFIGNWDLRSGLAYEQSPGFRTMRSLLSFGSVFREDPAIQPFVSFLDGQYATMWGDAWGNLHIANTPDHLRALTGAAYFAAAVPTTVILAGGARIARGLWRDPSRPADVLWLAFPVWVVEAVTLFALELPYSSTVKAFFFVSAVPALGVWLLRGRAGLPVWGRRVLDVSLVALALASAVCLRAGTAL